MNQATFCPVDFHFEWTENSYNWDYAAAHEAAKDARDKRYRELRRRRPRYIKRSVLKHQRISRGGIGSGLPHIELVCDVYMITWE